MIPKLPSWIRAVCVLPKLIGSEDPWVEAILLHYGAEQLLTVEFGRACLLQALMGMRVSLEFRKGECSQPFDQRFRIVGSKEYIMGLFESTRMGHSAAAAATSSLFAALFVTLTYTFSSCRRRSYSLPALTSSTSAQGCSCGTFSQD